MRTPPINALTAIFLFVFSGAIFGQAPNMGTADNFVLFTTNGDIVNTGISQLMGKVGSNNGSSTGFGNVNGSMHSGDGVTAQAAVDLLVAYNQLFASIPDYFHGPLLGGGQVFTPGVHAVSGAATLDLELILDAENDPNAVFIIQLSAALSTNAHSEVTLINGAQACNVYWKAEGLVSMATGTKMKGTVIADNAAITINTGCTLEGRALSTTGAVTVHGIHAYTPSGCGAPVLTGPTAPTLGEAACYGVFSTDGPIDNAGISTILGDVGSNDDLTNGFDPLLVSGNINPEPDASTAAAAADLQVAYDYLNMLSHDIILVYPAQFGGNLELTPHTYRLDGATTFTDTLYLNAQGESNAVFAIKVYGAFSTSTNANVVLLNSAQAKNVYWLVNGAIEGVQVNGRVLTGVGAMATNAIDGNAHIPSNCQTVVGEPNSTNEAMETSGISVHLNSFLNSLTVQLSDAVGADQRLRIYNVLGVEVMNVRLTAASMTVDTSDLPSGIYVYSIMDNGRVLQSGKLISQK